MVLSWCNAGEAVYHHDESWLVVTRRRGRETRDWRLEPRDWRPETEDEALRAKQQASKGRDTQARHTARRWGPKATRKQRETKGQGKSIELVGEGRAHTHLNWGSNPVPLGRFARCLLPGQTIVLPPVGGLQRHLL